MCLVNMTGKANFDWSNPQSGQTLSVDRPLFPALALSTGPSFTTMESQYMYNYESTQIKKN